MKKRLVAIMISASILAGSAVPTYALNSKQVQEEWDKKFDQDGAQTDPTGGGGGGSKNSRGEITVTPGAQEKLDKEAEAYNNYKKKITDAHSNGETKPNTNSGNAKKGKEVPSKY